MINTWYREDVKKAIASMRKHARKLAKSKRKSREFLIRAGIITKAG